VVIVTETHVPSHLDVVSLSLTTVPARTHLRCALLHGTQAEATCPFVFRCCFGEEYSGASLIGGLSGVENGAEGCEGCGA
jgi:hypothetical protein